MPNYYCKNCGRKYSDVRSLLANNCQRHPTNPSQGKHELYESSEKSRYTCKHCGREYTDLVTLTANVCQRHPLGSGKGKHSPAL